MGGLREMVLVTGATGAIGSRVVHVLHEAGCEVRTLARHRPEPSLFPVGVDVRMGDVVDARCVSSAMKDVDIVFHLAALLHVVNPSPALRKEYERINIHGTATVVETARQAGVRRVVYFSTIAVYGPSDGSVLTEATQPRPDTFYSESKLAGENIVLEANAADGEPMGTVLRLGAVYGSRVKANYYRLVRSLSSGRFIPLGKGLNRRTLVYDRDVAQAALIAARHPQAAGQVYNVTDCQYHTVDEIIKTICMALGRTPPPLVLPIAPLRIMVGLLEDCATFADIRCPVVRGTVDKYTEDIAVSGRRIKEELDFVPRYDLQKGWQETIHEMRRKGSL
jgi:nucleoside-diphosphate-sugar epimerase